MRDIVEIEGKKYVSFRMVVAMVISFYIALFVICSLYVKYDRAKRTEKTVVKGCSYECQLRRMFHWGNVDTFTGGGQRLPGGPVVWKR